MAEVFTISGAFGASKTGPAGQLQHALKVLGDTTGDSQLSRLKVDGVIGPNTVAALNYAFKTYGGSTKLDWTTTDVRKSGLSLVDIVSSVVHQQGGTVSKPAGKKRSGASAADIIAAQQAAAVPGSFLDTHPNLVWYGIAGVGIVLALGFMSARRRRAAQAHAPAPA